MMLLGNCGDSALAHEAAASHYPGIVDFAGNKKALAVGTVARGGWSWSPA
jgi:hypothetical protein